MILATAALLALVAAAYANVAEICAAVERASHALESEARFHAVVDWMEGA